MPDVPRLPLPVHLDPKITKRTLYGNVRPIYYQLYNNNPRFRELLVSVGNKDALTGNRMFDRSEAVDMIVEAAEDAKDIITSKAKKGEIYRCLVSLMRKDGIGLKLRRAEYKRLTHITPSE